MKTCGYCGNSYDDKEPKCPQCGATLLKHTKGAETASEEYKRLKEELTAKRKSRSKILAVAAAMLVLIVVIIISSIVGFFNDPQRAIAKEAKALLKQAEQLVDEGNYASAVDALDQINREWDDYSTTNQIRKEAERGVMLEKISEYQKSGNYEQLVAYVDSKISNVESDSEVYEVYAVAKQKVKEKLLAEMAGYMSSGDYFGAIQYFYRAGDSLVNDSDAAAVYNEAVAAYADAVIKEAENHAQAGDYASARAVLSTAQNYIGWVVELSDKAYELDVREVTEEATSYADAGKYRDAILYLNDHLDVVYGNPDLETKLSTYIEKYRANVLSEAASAYKSSGYEAAVDVLNSALMILNNDSVLTSEKGKYENLAPTALASMSAFHSDYGKDTKLTGVTLQDKLGNTYTNCIEYFGGHSLYVGGNVSTFDKRDIYVLGGQYVTFRAIVFVPEARSSYWDTEISDTNKSKGSFTLRIYGDGVLLYQSPLMISTQYPVKIEIDVSGVEQLSFSWATFNDVSSEIGLADAFLFKD